MDRDGDNPNSLAEKLRRKTKQPQIFKFLNGVAKEPRRPTLQPIADHYKISVEAFYDPAVASMVMDNLKAGRPLMNAGAATITLPSLASETSGDPPVPLETAIERVAQHLDSLGDYDRGTAVALMTTLARSPYMHASVTSGLVEMEKRAREDPANKSQPVFSRAAA